MVTIKSRIFTIISFFLIMLSVGESLSFAKIDFFTSMGWSGRWQKRVRRKNLMGQLLFYKDLYDKNFRETGLVKVPKVFHQIWVGPKTPPAIFEESQESIKRLHPDWEYKLWTDADLPNIILQNQELYNKARNYGEKADILRYEILYQFGGVYLDVDFICLKPFDPLCYYDFWTSLYPFDCRGLMANCVIGSVAGHPILKECIDSMPESWKSARLKDTVSRTGPIHFNKAVLKGTKEDPTNVMVFPKSYFFPLNKSNGIHSNRSNVERPFKKVDSLIRPESFAVHYWASSWIGAKVSKTQQPLLVKNT